MEALLVAAAAAFWLGLLTSISPCPLATNVAAISYLGKRVARPRRVLSAGLLYTLGRTVSYVLVALIAIEGLLSISGVSLFLQHNLNRILGPGLLVLGLLLLDVIPWPWSGGRSAAFERVQKHADKLGLWGASVLGLAFALAFCPLSAALFFGSLVPLAVQHESALLLPTLYGLGTALPVVAFSVVLAFAAHGLSRAFNVVTAFERWMRRLTAALFIAVGAYYCVIYLF